LVREYEAGSQSQRAFCAARGVGQSSLRYWKRRLERADGDEAKPTARAPRLVPVRLIEDAPAPADSGLVVVTPGGIRVEIARQFDTATLRRVLAAVEGA
jgi:transposase